MKIFGYSLPPIASPRLDSPANIAKKLTMLAVPIVGMMVLQAVTWAEAGPLAYAECMALCAGLTAGGFLPACAAACLPLLGAPTP